MANAGEREVDNGLFTRNTTLGTIKSAGELMPKRMNRGGREKKKRTENKNHEKSQNLSS